MTLAVTIPGAPIKRPSGTPPPTRSGPAGSPNRLPPRLIVVAATIALVVHAAAAVAALFFLHPERRPARTTHTLDVTLIKPPEVIPPKPPPPPPPPPKIKPPPPPPEAPPPPIQLPEEVSIAEPAPIEEPPLPVAPPVEVPIEPPEYNAAHLRNPPPAYPPIAKRLKIEGTVLVRVLVSPSGLPQQIELAQTSGSPVLDEAALNGVKNWAFVPARKGTDPIEAWVEIPIEFHLINVKQKG